MINIPNSFSFWRTNTIAQRLRLSLEKFVILSFRSIQIAKSFECYSSSGKEKKFCFHLHWMIAIFDGICISITYFTTQLVFSLQPRSRFSFKGVCLNVSLQIMCNLIFRKAYSPCFSTIFCILSNCALNFFLFSLSSCNLLSISLSMFFFFSSSNLAFLWISSKTEVAIGVRKVAYSFSAPSWKLLCLLEVARTLADHQLLIRYSLIKRLWFWLIGQKYIHCTNSIRQFGSRSV